MLFFIRNGMGKLVFKLDTWFYGTLYYGMFLVLRSLKSSSQEQWLLTHFTLNLSQGSQSVYQSCMEWQFDYSLILRCVNTVIFFGCIFISPLMQYHLFHGFVDFHWFWCKQVSFHGHVAVPCDFISLLL